MAQETSRRRRRPRKPLSSSLLKDSGGRTHTLTTDNRLTRSLLHTEATGSLQVSNRRERTYNLSQSSLLQHTNAATRSKASFTLDLSRTNLQPYIHTSFSRSGRTLLLASKNGHIATINWREARQCSELFLNETIHDATFLHNDLFYAIAQRKYTYIYDNTGVQLHVLRHALNPVSLSFLPHHLLLVSLSSNPRRISWTDTSTGRIVADTLYSANLRSATSLTSTPNSQTGIVSAAHVNGTVSLWSPNSPKPLATMFTHAGGVKYVVNSPDGRTMITAGVGAEIKVWDVRKFGCRGILRMEGTVNALDCSVTGLLAYGVGGNVVVHQGIDRLSGTPMVSGSTLAVMGTSRRFGGGKGKAGALYMRERYGDGKQVTSVRFCPFEDVLSVCLADGVRTMIVPGAGEAKWDASGPHPYEGRKERREKEIRALLDKLPPESISLDVGVIGGVERDAKERMREKKEELRMLEMRKAARIKKRTKGRNKIGKRLKRKQANVMDAKKAELLEKLEQRKREVKRMKKTETAEEAEPALKRFFKRRY